MSFGMKKEREKGKNSGIASRFLNEKAPTPALPQV
jgi:hypothetical protein